MSDIVPPCDCIELVDGQYTYCCDCSNRGDSERAAAWCVEANHKARAEYDKCTIEFLRKEASEAAAEIDRLRATLREIESNWEVPMEEKGWHAVARFMWETARAALGENE